MPKIPVDEAPAGPAMDAAVVEALGECGHFLKLENLKLEGMELRAGGSRCVKCGQRFAGLAYGESYCVKPYSTDIAAAWELVEVMSQDFGVEIDVLYPEADAYERCCCKIWKQHSLQFRSLFASSVPLAICRAFLKANGIEFVEVSE